jgi:SAM-dependent methyltransferase
MVVAAALTQRRLRERAETKFGPAAARMLFTPAGMEQATRASVAAHRARRFTGAGRVVDLCCGVGGDLVALAAVTSHVHGVDRDPAAVAAARANAAALGVGDRVSAECADVASVGLGPYDAAFLDPARRAGGRRVFDPADYSPPWSYVRRLADAVPTSAVKVAPGIPHELVPPDAEAEWVSDGGAVKEATLWFGGLRTTSRRATLLPSGATLTAADVPQPPVAPPRRWLYDPDGAVVRSHLIAELAAIVDGALVDPTIAYLTTAHLVPTPFARAYEVTDVLPFGLKRLRALLRARGVGRLTVKKRGSAVEPEELRRQLRLRGDGEAVVVLTRVAGAPTMLVCQETWAR